MCTYLMCVSMPEYLYIYLHVCYLYMPFCVYAHLFAMGRMWDYLLLVMVMLCFRSEIRRPPWHYSRKSFSSNLARFSSLNMPYIICKFKLSLELVPVMRLQIPHIICLATCLFVNLCLCLYIILTVYGNI